MNLPAKPTEDFTAEREAGFPNVQPEHKSFMSVYAEEYDFKGTCASFGLKPAAGRRLLGKPINKAFLNFLEEDWRDVSVLRKEWVELQWLETYEKLSGEAEIPFVNRDGIAGTVKKFHASETVSCLKEISHLSGADKEADGKGAVHININLSKFGLEEDGTIIQGEIVDGDA